jgi:hypothetical protein
MIEFITFIDESGHTHKVVKSKIEEVIEWKQDSEGRITSMVVLNCGREIFVPGTADEIVAIINEGE